VHFNFETERSARFRECPVNSRRAAVDDHDAPRLAWSDRTMRRKISGESPITKTEADAIRRLRPKKRESAS
jgi:hypothetical protein